MAETARLLLQQRIASKKYYDKKREIILQKHKEKRQLIKQVTDAPEFNAIEEKFTTIDTLVDTVNQLRLKVEALDTRLASQHALGNQQYHPDAHYAPEEFMDDPYDDARGSAPQQEGVIGETSVSLSPVEKTYLPNLEGIKQLLIDNKSPTAKKNTHKNAINQLFTLIGHNDLAFYSNSNYVIDKLRTSRFSINTQKTYLGALLKACSLYPPFKDIIGTEAYRAYDRELQVVKLKAVEQYKEKSAEPTFDFNEYFNRIKDHYGTESKEFIAILVFKIQTLRDNFDFVVTPDEKPTDKSKNWISVPPPEPVAGTSSFINKRLKLFLNVYKTSKKFEKFDVNNEITINLEDSKLIRSYITRNKILYGQYLFGSRTLGKFIASMNRNIGLNLTINDLRKSKESTEYNDLENPTFEQIVDISHRARHSVGVSLERYKRPVTGLPQSAGSSSTRAL
jgi:hypothetical protein